MNPVSGIGLRTINVGRKAAAAAVLLAGLAAAACGGAPVSPSTSGGSVTVLDAENFKALVLTPSRTSLVEFQRST
jgi:hypothetical protein